MAEKDGSEKRNNKSIIPQKRLEKSQRDRSVVSSGVEIAECTNLEEILAASEKLRAEIRQKEAGLLLLKKKIISLAGQQITPRTDQDLREIIAYDKSQYARHSTNLRNWLVAYGIGGILLLSRDDIIFKTASEELRRSTMLILIAGVACQAILAILNKYTHKSLSDLSEHLGTQMMFFRVGPLPFSENVEAEIARGETFWQKIAEYLERAIWPELVLDVSSIVLYGIATLRLWLGT